ncbi:MAG: LysR family transcriptional regulator [Myxococcales bacterium]|jgi:LysR family transcriptional activator of nhaA|nr:LysR family transcriptional regulator [Myxococcales bacterium]
MFNFHHLHYFWAVAHEGNLTRAAARLHVSQSAVSMQIQKLEDELGHPLFERRGKALVLTEAGRIALDHADAIFAHGRELESALGGQEAPRRPLRIGSLATLSRNFQLGFLQPLLARDDVEIVVRSGGFADLLRALDAHQLDVVLGNAAPPRDAATTRVAHPIAKQPVSLVGRPRRRRRPSDLAALLASEPLVLPAAESSIRAGFDALVARLGVRPRVAAEVDDMAMLRLFARERAGLAVVPPIVVQDELREGVLVEVAPLPLAETFFAITAARRFPNPLLEVLLRARRAR